MHKQISVLTMGKSRIEAHDRAIGFVQDLIEQGEYDYHMEGSPNATTHKLTSEMGQLLVEHALTATRRDFDLSIKAARLMLQEFTDDQIYNQQYGEPDPDHPREYWPSRWQFSQVGDGDHYLYGERDVWGEAICNDRDYENATEGRDDLWITEVGVHY